MRLFPCSTALTRSTTLASSPCSVSCLRVICFARSFHAPRR